MTTRHDIGIAEPGPNGWSLSFPAFPGVVTVGDSFGELVDHARDALASAVEAMQEDGLPLPADITDDPGAPAMIQPSIGIRECLWWVST